jgi:hypothetical protein
MAMVQHYQTHFLIAEILRKYNKIEAHLRQIPNQTRIVLRGPTEFKNQTKKQLFDETPQRTLVCKTCKRLFPIKSNEKLQIMKTETKSCTNCRNPNLEVVCRVCNLNIKSPGNYTLGQKLEHIEKHLYSEKHCSSKSDGIQHMWLLKIVLSCINTKTI